MNPEGIDSVAWMQQLAGRLDKLEGSLSPKAAVLLWLGEAHTHGSLPAYAASQVHAHHKLATLLLRTDRLDEAVILLEQGAEASPDSAGLLLALGQTYYKAGRWNLLKKMANTPLSLLTT